MVPLHSRHHSEQSIRYHINNHDNHDVNHFLVKAWPLVLYTQLSTRSDDENDSFESTVTPSAMIIGLENLIIFCHFDDTNGTDTNLFIFVNHEDLQAEEAEDLVVDSQILNAVTPTHVSLPSETDRFFASLYGQQVLPNQPPDLPSLGQKQPSFFQNTAPLDLNHLLAAMNKHFPTVSNQNQPPTVDIHKLWK